MAYNFKLQEPVIRLIYLFPVALSESITIHCAIKDCIRLVLSLFFVGVAAKMIVVERLGHYIHIILTDLYINCCRSLDLYKKGSHGTF